MQSHHNFSRSLLYYEYYTSTVLYTIENPKEITKESDRIVSSLNACACHWCSSRIPMVCLPVVHVRTYSRCLRASSSPCGTAPALPRSSHLRIGRLHKSCKAICQLVDSEVKAERRLGDNDNVPIVHANEDTLPTVANGDAVRVTMAHAAEIEVTNGGEVMHPPHGN